MHFWSLTVPGASRNLARSVGSLHHSQPRDGICCSKNSHGNKHTHKPQSMCNPFWARTSVSLVVALLVAPRAFRMVRTDGPNARVSGLWSKLVPPIFNGCLHILVLNKLTPIPLCWKLHVLTHVQAIVMFPIALVIIFLVIWNMSVGLAQTYARDERCRHRSRCWPWCTHWSRGRRRCSACWSGSRCFRCRRWRRASGTRAGPRAGPNNLELWGLLFGLLLVYFFPCFLLRFWEILSAVALFTGHFMT